MGGYVERRRFPRRDLRGTPIQARLVLTGNSLLKRDASHSIEIDARPVNLSRGGVGLTLEVDATWAAIAPEKEVSLLLEASGSRAPFRGKVVRYEGESRLMGLEFDRPLSEISRFLIPVELQ